MFRTEQQGAVNIVSCGAPLNREHIDDFRQAMDGCRNGQPRLVLDLADVALFDSDGLESLLDLQEEVEALGGAVKLAAAKTLCQDALRATGVGDRFELFDTVKAAVGSFSR